MTNTQLTLMFIGMIISIFALLVAALNFIMSIFLNKDRIKTNNKLRWIVDDIEKIFLISDGQQCGRQAPEIPFGDEYLQYSKELRELIEKLGESFCKFLTQLKSKGVMNSVVDRQYKTTGQHISFGFSDIEPFKNEILELTGKIKLEIDLENGVYDKIFSAIKNIFR